MKLKAIIVLSAMVMTGLMLIGPVVSGETNRASLEAIIEAKPYKVHHFLNARFNEVVSSNQLALK